MTARPLPMATALLVLAGSCATAMYDGPTRSRQEVALIDRVGSQTRILAIDGRPGHGDSHFAVLPGIHTLTLVFEGYGEGERSDGTSLPPLTVCFRITL